ncbi:type VI secretion system baseplate subunit TssE [Desulfobotulus sp.]|jgi:type VI secretion system lysozyme-like protein|uniref:type VI secretion system baseplate subunit TssE n=1 Tax=Desulfobotulus sp. TaxID=1940337 RepID=UPI002A36554E|nr:type VI secretion system baseplate subunit TssE [Desulfobotulus sp.]MDY0162848.1 type VI secretion system baseplate subunit TssE [Desulfobotulus sp.]
MALFKKFSLEPERLSEDQEEIRSIVEHLNAILNTKKGYGSPMGNLGMEDLSHYRSRNAIGRVIIEQIQYNIENFEPRLEIISIEHLEKETPMHLYFRLRCRLLGKSQEMEVVFDSASSFFRLNQAGRQ